MKDRDEYQRVMVEVDNALTGLKYVAYLGMCTVWNCPLSRQCWRAKNLRERFDSKEELESLLVGMTDAVNACQLFAKELKGRGY